MKMLIEVDMGGAAFDGRPAGELLAVIKRMPVDAIRAVEFDEPDCGSLRDSNGNTCGTWRVVADPAPKKRRKRT